MSRSPKPPKGQKQNSVRNSSSWWWTWWTSAYSSLSTHTPTSLHLTPFLLLTLQFVLFPVSKTHDLILSLLCFTEWRIPHLYSVLHQLPTVRPQPECVCVILISPPHTVVPASHMAPLCTSINAFPSFLPRRRTDTLHISHLSRSRSVYLQLCLRVSLPPSALRFLSSHSFIRCLLTELQLAHWQTGVL